MLKNEKQSGFALMEAMVAIVVLSLGVLGILGVQMRTLADTQTGVRRAQAIRLIEDLSERMKVNPSALENIGSYVIGWGVPSSPPDCKTNPCNAQNLALADIRQWKQGLQSTLPLADANVFLVSDETIANNRRQLGVMISWRENERADGSASENIVYQTPFTISSGGAGVSCPAGRTCHLQYIQLTSRCTPYAMQGTGTNQLFCPV